MFNERNVRRFRAKRNCPQRLRDGMRVRIHSAEKWAEYPVVRENNGVTGTLLYLGRSWSTVSVPGYDPIDIPTACIRKL